jgi:TPR repeat protein
MRTISREEAAALYSRGEQLIAVGDVVGARLLFLRAAEGGDVRSAFAMGASYDPDALKTLGIVGVVADVALAREWYAKASSLGSRDAALRIEMLVRAR